MTAVEAKMTGTVPCVDCTAVAPALLQAVPTARPTTAEDDDYFAFMAWVQRWRRITNAIIVGCVGTQVVLIVVLLVLTLAGRGLA